jgi:hypothetical protein
MMEILIAGLWFLLLGGSMIVAVVAGVFAVGAILWAAAKVLGDAGS